MEGIQEDILFIRANTRSKSSNVGTPENEMKLYKKSFRLDVAKYRFSNRVVNEWNKLPNNVIQANTLNAFKGKVDYYLEHIRGLR